MEMLMDAERKLGVWAKGRIIPGWDPAEWRSDCYGGVMHFSEYGQTTEHGWEIDHIDPNGADSIWNLQPLNWLNNRRKSDKPPGILGLGGSLAGPSLTDLLDTLTRMNRR